MFENLLSSYIDDQMPDKGMEIIENHGENLGKIGPTLCKITVLYIEKGQLESAIKCYTTAPEKNPNLSEAWESLGDMSLNLNRNEDAQIFLLAYRRLRRIILRQEVSYLNK